MGVTEIKKYPELTKALATKNLVVLDCFTSWCGPCKKIAPMLEELAKEYPGTDFYKVNIETVEQVAEKFEIKSIPTIIYFYDGKEIDRVVGANMGKISTTAEKHQ